VNASTRVAAFLALALVGCPSACQHKRTPADAGLGYADLQGSRAFVPRTAVWSQSGGRVSFTLAGDEWTCDRAVPPSPGTTVLTGVVVLSSPSSPSHFAILAAKPKGVLITNVVVFDRPLDGGLVQLSIGVSGEIQIEAMTGPWLEGTFSVEFAAEDGGGPTSVRGRFKALKCSPTMLIE
jgi:hypothetical protein